MLLIYISDAGTAVCVADADGLELLVYIRDADTDVCVADSVVDTDGLVLLI